MEFKKYQENIPTWAICYLVNGDKTGLKNDGIEMIDKWLTSYEAEGMHVDIVSPIRNENGCIDESFAHYPAFGSACSVIECDVLCTELKQP